MSSRLRPGSSSTVSETSYYESTERTNSPNLAFNIPEQKQYLGVGSPTTTVTRVFRQGGSPQTTEWVPGDQQQYHRGNEVTYVQNSLGHSLSSPIEIQNRQHQYVLSQSLKGINVPKDSEVIVHKTYLTVDPVPSIQVCNNTKDFQSYQNVGNSQTHWENVKYNERHARNVRSPVQLLGSPNEHIRSRSAQSSVTSQDYDIHSDEPHVRHSGGRSPVPARVRSPQTSQIKSAMDYESGNTEKLDPRYFGELLAELTCKTTELHNILLENMQKIKGKQNTLEVNVDLNGSNENVEALIPKGVSELTKQHLRYILQTRLTVDKSLRLLLATFSSLREDLLHLQDDLSRLATDKEMLERDLGFKSQQVTEYLQLLESVRENNRQLQSSIKESGSSNRSLEDLILTLRNSEADKEFRVKELECSKRALEQENELLRQQLIKSPSSPSFASVFNTEISNNYYEMVNQLREEKDKEISALRSQISNMKREMSSGQDNTSSLQMKLMQYSNSLSEKDSIIQKKNEEIMRLRSSSLGSNNVTHTIITKRYLDYPILGLLKDRKLTSPSKELKTIFIEKNGRI
ncbi:protein POF1B [Pristis pectinata]|uniref:protein POF1B n=1 Tax=Pristis pectinata TaxID=685728 RepID=UPI00223DD52C|nr:protein POF1B [Pristis pectinata]